MTDQEINVAIALIRGWKRPDDPDVMKFKQGWLMPEKWWMDPLGVLKFKHDIPDYCNDLNAMHSAESTIVDWRRYSDVLMQVIEDSSPELAVRFLGDRVGLRYYSTHATARQRAEAFLRVKVKWKE